MKTLNSKWLFLAILAAFIALCLYSRPKPQEEISFSELPASQQPGYTTAQNKAMQKFVSFQIKQQATIMEYRNDLAALNHSYPVE